MIRVIGTAQKEIHEATCKNCASKLEYTLNEVKEYNGRDYSGGSDGHRYIRCPSCSDKIILKSW